MFGVIDTNDNVSHQYYSSIAFDLGVCHASSDQFRKIHQLNY